MKDIKRIYSHALNDTYTKRADGILFNSGVFYSNAELLNLDGIRANELKNVHIIKKAFNGTLCEVTGKLSSL